MRCFLRRMAGVLVAGLALVAMSGCCLVDTTYSVENGGVGYEVSESQKMVYVTSLTYKPGDDTNIVMMDEYNGCKVTTLGTDKKGNPFQLRVEIDESNCEDSFRASSLENYSDYEVTELDLYITLPKTLKRIANYTVDPYYGYTKINEDGSKQKIIIEVKCHFTIDEDNSYFYSKDGKLYQKKTDALMLEWNNN